MRWLLTRAEIGAFIARGLEKLLFDTLPDVNEPDVGGFPVLVGMHSFRFATGLPAPAG